MCCTELVIFFLSSSAFVCDQDNFWAHILQPELSTCNSLRSFSHYSSKAYTESLGFGGNSVTMASTGIDYAPFDPYRDEKKIKTDAEKEIGYDNDGRRASISGSVKTVYDSTHRKLKPRHIQLIGIGGTIGTALYVQIGRGLMNGGPGSLFMAFTIW